jgi:ribosomal-protein-alanine N-acetyltransferase
MDQKKAENCPVPFIEGERIYLRGVCLSDADENYYRWMNDDKVTQYLESRFYPHSVESIASYISQVNESSDSVFLAVVAKEKNVHIGNIKIGSINWIHRYADVGIMIGEKAYWGQGLATEAIKLVVDYAFNKLNLRRLEAGCYANNLASIRAFQKAGFTEEGRLKQRYFWNGEYVDRVCLGIIRGN